MDVFINAFSKKQYSPCRPISLVGRFQCGIILWLNNNLNNLRRALPNDYWTAESVEDYMRCKVINFPIGVQNEAMRRNAFR